MSNSGLAEKISHELRKHNVEINGKIDEIMQNVLADPEITSRSDWPQVQKTLGLIVSSMTACDFSEPIDANMLMQQARQELQRLSEEN